MIEFFFCAYEYPEFALWPSGKKSRTTWIVWKAIWCIHKNIWMSPCDKITKFVYSFNGIFKKNPVCIVFKVHVGHSSKR